MMSDSHPRTISPFSSPYGGWIFSWFYPYFSYPLRVALRSWIDAKEQLLPLRRRHVCVCACYEWYWVCKCSPISTSYNKSTQPAWFVYGAWLLASYPIDTDLLSSPSCSCWPVGKKVAPSNSGPAPFWAGRPNDRSRGTLKCHVRIFTKQLYARSLARLPSRWL